MVYYYIFYSHLWHGYIAWCFIKEINIDWVNKLQKHCIQILTFSDFNSRTIDIFARLKRAYVQDVFPVNKLIFMFDYTKDCIPDELKSLFTFNYEIH